MLFDSKARHLVLFTPKFCTSLKKNLKGPNTLAYSTTVSAAQKESLIECHLATIFMASFHWTKPGSPGEGSRLNLILVSCPERDFFGCCKYAKSDFIHVFNAVSEDHGTNLLNIVKTAHDQFNANMIEQVASNK